MSKIATTCIIDDDPIFVFGAQKIMEMTDFSEKFIVFGNGQEAIEGLKPMLSSDQPFPEVILLDLNMPIMDGWEFLDEFITIPREKAITIYIVTSSIDPEDIKRVKEYDVVNKYILKPVTVDALKEILEDLKRAAS
ncbi:MAG: response regulator [Thermonemataceae bacterium]